MGVFDFVKQGVREMMIARHDQYKHFIVYKHPNQNIPMYSQLTVDSDECAVFFKDVKANETVVDTAKIYDPSFIAR